MERETEWLRRKLGSLTGVAIRLLASLARRLGTPALLSTVPVSAAMLTRLESVTPAQSLEDAASMFVAGGQPFLPVVEGGAPVGAVTKDDLAVGLRRVGPQARVSEAPRHAVVTVTPSDSLADVLEQLRGAPESVAIVVDNGEAVGLLTFDHLVEYLEKKRAA